MFSGAIDTAYNVGGESSPSSDTFNSTPKWKYDVFLSFAGKEATLRFTYPLHEAFKRNGIICFRDEEGIERGEGVSPRILQAIKDSRCAVVVLSENYADSTWCLDVLQMILECRSKLGQRVFPIFYDIDPSDVRRHGKNFGVALAKHEERFRENRDKVQNWRNALSEISNLSGWDTRVRDEADLIKNVVMEIWAYLNSKLPSYTDKLVGIDSRVVDMMLLLEIGLDDNHFVGIWGMGGVGKTTLARVVSEKISHKFDVCCFLANVRETLLRRKGLVSLQKRLLSYLKIKDMKIRNDYEGMTMIRNHLHNKKVLLVLDNLDDTSQLKNLAESPYWFGEGSRIIITTRERNLLIAFGVQRIYEMTCMEEDESLKLFSNKAFKKDDPEEDYLELSKSVVQYAGGLPLALVAMGSYLYGRSEKALWRDALDKLRQTNPHKDILEVLKISYDGLDEEKQMIFLDVVCFFKRWKKKKVTQILKCCRLSPIIGIQELVEKTLLVETKDCRLDMHKLYEDLGWDLIQKEYPNSRLWKLKDIKEVLENNKGSDAIQAIVMKDHDEDSDKIKVLYPEAFSKMNNIRMFICTGTISPFILPTRLKLPGALKVIQWPSFPFETLPLETPFDKLVHIDMYDSKIIRLWNDIQPLKMLRSIDMSYSCNLIETPNFVGIPNLEHLCLHGCKSLVKVDSSLGKLEELVEVDLSGCVNLEILPKKLETKNLIKLDLSWCKKVAKLPEFGEGMKKLLYLDVSDTAISRLPESLEYLSGLRYLNLSRCKFLNVDNLLKSQITRQIPSLHVTSLTELCLRGCGLNDGSIPDDFGSLTSLVVLDLSGNNVVNLPTGCFFGLFRLVFLSLDRCERLKTLPRLPPRLVRLNASGCKSMEGLSLDSESWKLVASLDHEYREQTKYVISDDEQDDDIALMYKHVEQECLPLRDFCAIIPGRKIPSWFPNKGYYYPWDRNRGEYEIKANIPLHFRESEWSGIVVCLHIFGSFNGLITWSSKAAEDDDYIFKQWAHFLTILGDNHQNHHLCIMVLGLNEKTCWHHLRGHNNNSLHIKLSTCYESDATDEFLHGKIFAILGCGWRVIRKEEIQEWCNNHNDFAQPQLPATPDDGDDELNLPSRVLVNFFGKSLSPPPRQDQSSCIVM